jgi:hypothetical protein
MEAAACCFHSKTCWTCVCWSGLADTLFRVCRFTSAACLEPACSNARIALYSWIGGYILELAELQRRIPGILCTPHTHLLHVRNVALTLRGVVALEQCSDGGLSQQKGVNI